MTFLTQRLEMTGCRQATAAVTTRVGPPVSAVRWYDPVLSLVLAAFLYCFCEGYGWTVAGKALVMTLSATLLLCALEIARAPWRRTPRPPQVFARVARRAAVKWLGTMACLAAMLYVWSLLQEYAGGRFQALFEAEDMLVPFVPPVAALVILFTEWRLGPAEDAAWHLGLAALGQWKKADQKLVPDGVLGWMVRGFFLPLNFCALCHLIHVLQSRLPFEPWPHAVAFFTGMISILMITAILPGYLLSARLTGAGIRKMDQTWFGWTVTLVCYQPFMAVVFGHWLNFYTAYPAAPGEQPWSHALRDAPLLLSVAGTTILLLELAHYWSEALFGLRSSILANRGIITNGPYRFCKHPVYLVKTLSWLIIWMPFYAGGSLWEDCRLTFLWACVCAIYAGRAWAEERLLSDDPVYVAYALWVDEHGICSGLGRRLPVLSFKWRLARWQPQEENM